MLVRYANKYPRFFFFFSFYTIIFLGVKEELKISGYSCMILNLDGMIAHVTDMKVFSTYHYHVQAGPSVN